jgi:hypothetical protein
MTNRQLTLKSINKQNIERECLVDKKKQQSQIRQSRNCYKDASSAFTKPVLSLALETDFMSWRFTALLRMKIIAAIIAMTPMMMPIAKPALAPELCPPDLDLAEADDAGADADGSVIGGVKFP